MIRLSQIPVILLLIGISIYTVSYGSWTWKKKNRPGAIMVFLLALVNIALPLYTMLSRN